MAAGTMRPVLFGEVLFDHFPDGSRVLGGAPFNVAWHLQGFGMAPLTISRVGDDREGAAILDAMRGWGMDTAGIQRDPHHPTGAVEVRLQGGEPSFEILPEQAYDYIEAAGLPEVADGALVYHGSLALREHAPRHALDALLRRTGLPRFVDVNLRPPWWDRERVLALIDGASWVKINAAELDALSDDRGAPEPAARALQERCGINLVIVTLGSEGAVAVERDGPAHRVAPGPRVEVIDTVGAGDGFAAVTLRGIVEGWPVPLTLERAQDFASAVVGLRGATTDDRGFYARFNLAWESP